MKEQFNAYWRTRSPRDRRVITVVVLVVALSFFYAYLWMPMSEARSRLRAELPKLRGAAAEMTAEAAEAARLKAIPASAARAASADTINQSAARAGLKDELSEVTPLSPQRVQVALNSVAFDRWVGWTRALAAESGLRIESAQITTGGEPGKVKVQAVLALPGR